MGKDPAFLFYYQDFAYGTRKMSFEEKGCYIELLCEQADIGHLSLTDIQRSLKNSFPIWDAICSKFIKDKDGLFYNEVLEQHISKRKKFTQSRLNNLHMGNHMDDHTNVRMEDVNVNRNKDVKTTIRFTPPTLEEIRIYIEERKSKIDAVAFHAFYETNGWKQGSKPIKKWKACLTTWESRQKASVTPNSSIPVLVGKRPPELIVLELRTLKWDDQRLKDHLLEKGYTEREVDMALGRG